MPDPVVLSSSSEHAAKPFDDPDADVIIRSSDDVDFRLYKLLLSLSSPVFRAMFDLPQPTLGDWKDGLPVVRLSEDSKTLFNLLLPIFPWGIPQFDTVQEWHLVLEAGEKYQMDGPRVAAGKALTGSKFIETQSLGVYALAIRFNLEELARIAAASTLLHNIPGLYSDELDGIRATALHRLIVYHQECGRKAADLIVCPKGVPVGSIWNGEWFRCSKCEESHLIASVTNTAFCSPSRARRWWTEFLSDVEAKLKERPCPETLRDSIPTASSMEGFGCAACRVRALADTAKLMEGLMPQVSRAIDSVGLHAFTSELPSDVSFQVELKYKP
ncbi:hypothetical protein JAAARDRAFT_710831 [Jaapia argillacea MUCL 33604]|uniref:BTB domain-containing protein n=1 Tax=Jaapia argillacea MUCL 33604 TaxID=933084 RepID=A0A067P6T2_9AGAM|nr:hypothetical protein JAAARDRAFT_710831 [Jaapia argillacea MUCL 33604]